MVIFSGKVGGGFVAQNDSWNSGSHKRILKTLIKAVAPCTTVATYGVV
jgi:hypothetical protein